MLTLVKNMETKKQIRAEAKQFRDGIAEDTRVTASADICGNLIQLAKKLQAKRYYVYAPLGSEVDIWHTVWYLLDSGYQIAFPKVCGNDMYFIEVTDPHTQLARGTFHVMEPVGGPVVDWQDAVIFVPGLVFDKKGHRVGYGKGYYDRYLASHSYRMTLGVAYSSQIYKSLLPAEEQDIRIQSVCTEKGILRTLV